MYSLVRELEARPLTSFPAIFGEALSVGWLSRRRVYHEALQYEKDRSGGRMSPFGFSAITAQVRLQCGLQSLSTPPGIYEETRMPDLPAFMPEAPVNRKSALTRCIAFRSKLHIWLWILLCSLFFLSLPCAFLSPSLTMAFILWP
jgi:hypothetical protein